MTGHVHAADAVDPEPFQAPPVYDGPSTVLWLGGHISENVWSANAGGVYALNRNLDIAKELTLLSRDFNFQGIFVACRIFSHFAPDPGAHEFNAIYFSCRVKAEALCLCHR